MPYKFIAPVRRLGYELRKRGNDTPYASTPLPFYWLTCYKLVGK